MKEVSAQHILSYSSEDTVHVAENLLKTAAGPSKWLCKSAGEKEAFVIFQLEKACKIDAIDVGNAGSAFVEILVSRSSDDYKVLVVASSLMTPAECKAWRNISGVRMFSKENMSQAVADQKWDRVKVVCRQPFNKLEKFGLSFLRLRGPADADENTKQSVSPSEGLKLGKFSLRPESPPRAVTTGSFFSQRRTLSTPTQSRPSMAAQARDASTAMIAKAAVEQEQATSSVSTSSTQSSRHQTPPPSSAQAKTSTVKQTANPPTKPEQRRSTATKEEKSSIAEPQAKRPRVERIARAKVAFEETLKGVTFALSGFQNPTRGELRDKGLALGAQYRPQWDKKCTHLIAAFPNTPKYNQVKGQHGIIVNRQWIEQCHKTGQRFSTRRFVFAASDGSDSGSENETSSSAHSTAPAPVARRASGQTSRSPSPSVSSNGAVTTADTNVNADPSSSADAKPDTAGVESDMAKYDESTDEEVTMTPPPTSSRVSDEEDTEDEIERVRQEQASHSHQQMSSSSSGSDTEIDEDLQDHRSPQSAGHKKLPLLPNFFADLHFLLYGDFSALLQRQLVRYLTAYDGTVLDYMGDSVTHVVTESEWDDNFDKARSDNSTLIFVKPTWVMACHDAQCLVAVENYVIEQKTS